MLEVYLLKFADETGHCYKALGFSPGFAPDANVSPYLKLLPMLAGIGSPGTIQEVNSFSVDLILASAVVQNSCSPTEVSLILMFRSGSVHQ